MQKVKNEIAIYSGYLELSIDFWRKIMFKIKNKERKKQKKKKLAGMASMVHHIKPNMKAGHKNMNCICILHKKAQHILLWMQQPKGFMSWCWSLNIFSGILYYSFITMIWESLLDCISYFSTVCCVIWKL